MGKTGRYRVYMTIGVTVLVIILAINFLIFKPNASSGLWYMLSIVILLALISIAISVRNVKKTEERIKTLPKAYVDVYIDAQEVIGLSSMSYTMKKETMAMILEIFEHAHLEKREIEDVIQGDLNQFIDGFLITSAGNGSFIYWLAYSSFLFIMYLLFMKVYKVIRVGDFSIKLFETELLDLGITLTYAIIAYIFFPWLMYVLKKAAKEHWDGLKRLYVVLPFVIPVGLMGSLIAINTPDFRAFLDFQVPIFNSLFSFIVGLILMALAFLVMKLEQKRQVKKELG